MQESTCCTADAGKEKRMENISFGFSETNDISEEYALHCHNAYEVYYFMDGEVDYMVEGTKYEPAPDSILLLSPHMFHGVKVKSEKPYRRFTVHFDSGVLGIDRRRLLLSSFGTVVQTPGQKIYYENVSNHQIPFYLERLQEYRKNPYPEMREQLIVIGIEALLAGILTMVQSENAIREDPCPDNISEIIWYLNRNLKEEITLDMISERFFISKHHLNKVFRKATGTTVVDYLIRKRISMAQHLLINGLSAQEAAAEVGFDDYSSFYRSYMRVTGHSPAQDKGVSG